MNKEFEQAFKALNQQQKRAASTLEGPLLVIAGPGTGKTQLLSTRVANILKTTDTRATNILCLTFTNKAAVNMKERIMQMTGPVGAKVVASTFHSFAAEIMNLYPDYFWNAAAMSVAPESVQLDIVESIVAGLPLDNPLALKFAGQYTLLKDIQQAISLTKDAGLTPTKLRAIIRANLAYIDEVESRLIETTGQRLSAKNLDDLKGRVGALPKQLIDKAVYPLTSLSTVITDSLDNAIEQDDDSGRATNTSAWKSRWIQTVAGEKGMFKERDRNIWWLALADIYETYRQRLHRRGFYDYADMLVETISQLEQTPEILADIQERFNYVLIDEFQDTNPAQLRLAHLIADHFSANGSPNLMAVGDDDQSIFKFNGAELNNMLGFRRAYPSAEVIVLGDNYRSSQAILDTARQIIEQAEVRLVKTDPSLSKYLVAKSPPKDKGKIVAEAYSSRELQLSSIARDIQKNYSPAKTTAVLARGHDSLVKMAAILQGLSVPVRYEQASNILDHEIVDQVYLIIKLLLAIGEGDRSEANASVHQIIRAPMWGIEPEQLWYLAAGNYPSKSWLDGLLKSGEPKLKQMGEWFVWLAKAASNQPLAITIEQILGLRPSGEFTSPARDYYVQSGKDNPNKYFHGLSAIQLLRALVHEFGQDKEPTLEELARFIEMNRTNGVVVADESPFITGTHAVQLLTVHKAKGLEFDAIYIIDAIQDNWQPRKGSRKPPANLPLQPAGDDWDDYVRLMYVAASRAKSRLTISAYYQDHAGKDVAISPIAQGALAFKKIDEASRPKLTQILVENLRWPSLDGGQEREILKARLETYSLSVTHLLNFLDVTKGGPQYFKERNLLRLPEAKKAHLGYGTAMHAALEEAQKLINKSRLDLAGVNRHYRQALKAEQLTSSDYKRYLGQGKRILAKLLGDFGYRLPKGSLPEQKLKDIRLGSAMISGKLDRIDRHAGLTRIIDYKTGRPLGSFDTKDKKMAVKAYKHKLQLIFYALLVSQSGRVEPGQIESQMVYIEAANPKELLRTYTPSPQDIARLQKLIEAVWQKITRLELPDISTYSPDIDGIKAFEQDLLDGH